MSALFGEIEGRSFEGGAHKIYFIKKGALIRGRRALLSLGALSSQYGMCLLAYLYTAGAPDWRAPDWGAPDWEALIREKMGSNVQLNN